MYACCITSLVFQSWFVVGFILWFAIVVAVVSASFWLCDAAASVWHFKNDNVACLCRTTMAAKQEAKNEESWSTEKEEEEVNEEEVEVLIVAVTYVVFNMCVRVLHSM